MNKILVFGAGAIGSVIGGFLSKVNDVTLLGRKANMQSIRSKGLTVTGIWGEHHFRNLKTEIDFQRLLGRKAVFDFILVTVKSYDTLEAAKLIRKILHAKTTVLSLQNGLGNIEALEAHLPKNQILAARIITGMTILKPGTVKVTVSANPTAIGEPHQKKMTQRVKFLVQMFREVGIPVVPTEDVCSMLWSKVIYNCALNPLASLLGCHYGKLTERKETHSIMDEVIEEIYEVASAAHVRLQPVNADKYRKLFYTKLVPTTFHHRPSMSADLERGKKTEIDSLNGEIVRLGKRYSVKMPVNEILTALIKLKEKISQ